MDRWLVVYDTLDDRRRYRLARILDDYGDRVQYSVFEVTTIEANWTRLLARLQGVLSPEEDSLRLYAICDGCARKVQRLAAPGPDPWWEPEVYIVQRPAETRQVAVWGTRFSRQGRSIFGVSGRDWWALSLRADSHWQSSATGSEAGFRKSA